MTAPPPPPYGAPGAAGPAPNNNLVWAILSTIFCLPLGIVAIVKAAQVNTLWAQGQYDAANKSAEDAKKWSIWAAVLGIAGALVYVIVVFVIIGNASNY